MQFFCLEYQRVWFARFGVGDYDKVWVHLGIKMKKMSVDETTFHFIKNSTITFDSPQRET